MEREQIISLAREAGLLRVGDGWTEPHRWGATEVSKFAALAFAAGAAHERERCVKLLEDFSQTTMVPVVDTWRMGLIAGANAIRAREQT